MDPNSSFFDTLVGKRIAGRYLVDRLLGSGGMGIVASAKYPELGQKVAIKFLRPELASDTRVSARFMREARVAAKVKSAHFVRVFDVGRLESGIPYLVMEMLAGRDLGDELRARGQLPVADAIDCILQALTGVAEIHALGIVHRDLKPSNLFIANVAGTNIVKVLDFGISKEKPTESLAPLTATDHVLGTPQYMSPEQIKASRDVDPRSDIWALGVILYELLARSLPFESEGGGVGEMFGKILYVDPEPLAKHRSDLPDGLEAVILKCMSRDRDARYASALELAEALRTFASVTSHHRIDAVKQAGLTPAAEVDDDPILEVSHDEPRGSNASTVESSPDAKRELLVNAKTALAESAPEVSAAAVSAPVTAMTSSTSSRKIVKPGAASSRKPLLGAVAVLAVVGIGAGVMMTRTAPSTGMTAASATESAASASAAAAVLSAPTPAPVDTGITVILPASGASAAASASASTASAPGAAGVTAVRPRASAPATGRLPSRPPASAAPPATTAPPALILDRK